MRPLSDLLHALGQASDPAATALLAEEALAQLRREDDPGLWASMQGTWAAATATAAGGRLDEALAQRLIGAYEAALEHYRQESAPEVWVQTLCNLAAVHLDAVDCGLDQPQAHLEAAIAALEPVLAACPPAATGPGLEARIRLGRAWMTAAGWQGPAAMAQAAEAYRGALSAMTLEHDPERWPLLQLTLARCELESGGPDVEPALEAAERAAAALAAAPHGAAWAEAQLLRGACYRTRRFGDRAANLEAAVHALDAALTVFTREAAPGSWLEAHYHRGPAYLFRQGGDRLHNLDQAEASLRISIQHLDPSHPSQAGLMISLAQALLDACAAGPRDARCPERREEALRVLESLLPRLDARAAPAVWRLAHRYLAEALLGRAQGSRADNTERAIAALQAVQADGPAPDDDAGHWRSAQYNLGIALVRREQGPLLPHRLAAMACFRSVWQGPGAESDPACGAAQAWLALLSMDPVRPVSEPEAGPHDFAGQARRSSRQPGDPLELARQQGEELAAVARWRAGEAPRGREAGWHVPFQLNECRVQLCRAFNRFLDSGLVPQRDPAHRAELEAARQGQWLRMVGDLEEKHRAARRTSALLEEVRAGRQAFVLFLRGFNQRATYLHDATIVEGTGALEAFAKQALVRRLHGLPVLWIANPVDSTWLDLAAGGLAEEDLGFRIEAGETWEQDVRTLVGSASRIVMNNRSASPGVLFELRLLASLGRLGDTLFEDAEGANRVLGRSDCAQASDAALESLRQSARPGPPMQQAMPQASCRWVDGARRATYEREIHGLEDWMSRWPGERRHWTDLERDACWYRLAHALLLEDLPAVADCQRRLAASLQSPLGAFEGAQALAEQHLQAADTLRDRRNGPGAQ